MKITLSEWASRRYSPPPSAWTLRRWAREGDIHPAPERVGKAYYVDEHARRLSAGSSGAPTLVQRIQGAT
ncbi:MAG: hypothetical protein RLY71_2818 [Pseudomonadota bacterium]|jgi:predicted site-specific integrase-resolvase